jgi:hypothetical protein
MLLLPPPPPPLLLLLLLLLQVLHLSNGSSVSAHAYIAEQVLLLMSAHKDCSSNCLVWGKADKLIKHVLQVSNGFDKSCC